MISAQFLLWKIYFSWRIVMEKIKIMFHHSSSNIRYIQIHTDIGIICFCQICTVLSVFYQWCILYVSWQIHTDTYRYIQIHKKIHSKCMYHMYLYVSLAISCAYLVHIICICMYLLQAKPLVGLIHTIHTDTYRYAQDMHKIHAKYIQNTCRYMHKI